MHNAILIMVLNAFAPLTSVSPMLDVSTESTTQPQRGPSDDVLGQLERARASADDPDAIARLTTALMDFEVSEQRFVHNRRALELRTRAQLELARAQLAADDELGADLTIRAAIRDRHGGALRVKDLGPVLAEAYHEQQSQLRTEGRASITLVHPTPCELVVNGRPARSSTIELPLGSYRVHIRALDGSVEAHRFVELTAPGKVVKVRPVSSSPAATDHSPAPTTDSSPSAEQNEAQRVRQPEQAARARQYKRSKTRKAVGAVVMDVGTGLLFGGGAGVIWW